MNRIPGILSKPCTPLAHLFTNAVRCWAERTRWFTGYRARWPLTPTNPERLANWCREQRDRYIAKLRAEVRASRITHHAPERS